MYCKQCAEYLFFRLKSAQQLTLYLLTNGVAALPEAFFVSLNKGFL